jgi:pimeloyl-ACP methyl ester carboxylesterase
MTSVRSPQTTVRFAILVSPSAVTPARRLAYATARVMRALAYDDATVRRVSGLRRRLDEAFRRGAAPSMRASVDAVRDEPWFADAPLPDPDDPAWGEIMDADQGDDIARLAVPVLITHGEDDRWVPIDESIELWRDRYRGPRLEIVRLARTGHVPTIADDPLDLEERGPVSVEYERALLSFLARVAA